MAEVAYQAVTADYNDMDLQELVQIRKTITERKSDLAREVKAIEADVRRIDAILLAFHEDNPLVDRLSFDLEGFGATNIAFTEETVFNTEADMKEQIRDWLFENNLQHLMTWSLNNAATRMHVELHGELPHITPYVKKKVSMTKDRRKKT